MRTYVPNFVAVLVMVLAPNAFATDYGNLNSWERVKAPLNCADGGSTEQDKHRCKMAELAFCSGSTNCTLPHPTNGVASNKAQIEEAIKKAGAACKKNSDYGIRSCSTNSGGRGAIGFDKGSMQEMCRQYQNAADGATKINFENGGTCQGVRARCEYECDFGKKEIDKLVKNCSDCGQGYNPAQVDGYNLLVNGDQSCAKIDGNIYLDQGRATLNAGNIAEKCKEYTASAPAAGDTSGSKPRENKNGGGGGMNAQQLLGMAAMAAQMLGQNQGSSAQPAAQPPAVDSVDCSVNGNLAGCVTNAAATDDPWATKGGTAANTTGDSTGGSYNVGDDAKVQPASVDSGTGERAMGSAQTVAGVPNGGGGFAGGGGAGASLGGAAGGGGGGAAGKTAADILHGLGSAGGSMGAMNAGMNLKNGEGGGGFNYGQGGMPDGGGLDLSQFLPGGKQDPTRKIAGIGGAAPANFQIQSKEVNIWSRISERIQARCSQGLLRDCIP